MKVPIEWLKELVSFRAGADQLAEMLTMAGLETTVLPENVLEVDVLPNRADAWSVLGIAREISAITNFKLKNKSTKVRQISKKAADFLHVEVREKELCPRYMARVIEGVKVCESPAWLKKRLELAGMRSINNIVDVINYLLMELGQPMHAFDAALVKSHEIMVRKANPEEKITTLDGKEHILSHDVLVIADPEKAIAIAGIMGGAETEVCATTRDVILESAFFDPIFIHRAAKNLKLRTESSVRFEHGVDWNGVEDALERAAEMIAQLGKGRVYAGKIDVVSKKISPVTIELRPERVNQLLGADIPVGEMKNILKKLGFKITGNKVEVPLYRLADVAREIDLVEEIARIYGYGRFNPTMPSTAFAGKEVNQEEIFREKVREIMLGSGFSEAQTYTLISPSDFEKVSLPLATAVKIDNPMTVEESVLRSRLLPGLLNAVSRNQRRQNEAVCLFEIGKVFKHIEGEAPEEKWTLCALATSLPLQNAFEKEKLDYFYFKGMLENLLSALKVEEVVFTENTEGVLQPGKSAVINGLGEIGQLHPTITQKFALSSDVYLFEVDLTALFARLGPAPEYTPLPKFPSVTRDIALYVAAGVSHQMIVELVRTVGGELVEDIFLFDKYQNSLAYRLVYRHKEHTLQDEEVNQKHANIISLLEEKLKVKVRK